jgi:TPR repeat protein
MLSALVNRLARLASPATAHQRAIRLSDQGKLPEAFSLLALAARAGIADAEYRVARCYLEGLGVPPSQVEGTRWLQRAANHGVVEAQALLGAIFATGLVSVDVDRPEGTASADRLFASDVSGEPDLSSALKWARRAAEAGSAKGQGGPSTTLADLLTPLRVANPFSAMRASLRRWSRDEFEDCVTHGGQGGLRRRPIDSFFPASLF